MKARFWKNLMLVVSGAMTFQLAGCEVWDELLQILEISDMGF